MEQFSLILRNDGWLKAIRAISNYIEETWSKEAHTGDDVYQAAIEIVHWVTDKILPSMKCPAMIISYITRIEWQLTYCSSDIEHCYYFATNNFKESNIQPGVGMPALFISLYDHIISKIDPTELAMIPADGWLMDLILLANKYNNPFPQSDSIMATYLCRVSVPYLLYRLSHRSSQPDSFYYNLCSCFETCSDNKDMVENMHLFIMRAKKII